MSGRTDRFGLVQDRAALARAIAGLRAGRRVALDVEADGFHRYPERVALVQVAGEDGSIWLMDPLALGDLGPLGQVLGDPEVTVVAHAAGYDVRSLHRDYGFRVRGLFDTAIGAQFCGARLTGLAHVAEAFLGVRLEKSKRLQRTDWSRRPLAPEALAYAADDVRHLLALADLLAERLAVLGRRAWVAEECRRLACERFRAHEPPEAACLGLTGARQLTDRGRAVLRELYLFREAEALRLGRPPYRVVSEKVLLELAARPETPLEEVRGIDRHCLGRVGPALEAAIARGLRAPGVPWPGGARRELWPSLAQARLKRLKAWRGREAEALDLDPGVVWPMEHLRQIALHPDRDSEALDRGHVPPCVRRWQWDELGPSLEAFRRERLEDRPGGGAAEA